MTLWRNLPPMPAHMIDGKALAATVREEVAAEVEELGDVGLTTILVGDDPASHVYISGKHKAATSVGIHANDLRLPADTPQNELLELIAGLNADDSVDGLLVQLPLPAHID
ncbi:MAG: methylenetetrahydrofolate dehydrogenase / methenyltetrahydrofolate cyclohydrolase [Gaiellaceae bacterium]|nr:methylenetetrahydrofolate dehydrogenase / methenyltetrahydrofolate cyclohydrolase [Gaiellaceae bacterium]